MSEDSPAKIPPGWYNDVSGRQRWWDGNAWTDFFAPVTVPRRSGIGCFGVFGIISLVVLVVLTIFAFVVISNSVAGVSGGTGVTTAKVRYEVDGTATDASIAYETPTGSQQNDVNLPLAKTTGTADIRMTMERGAFVYISAQNLSDVGSVTCRILVDGKVISENTSTAAYGIAQCDGTAE